MIEFSNTSYGNPSLNHIIGKGYSSGGNYDLSALDSSDNFGYAVALSEDATQLVGGAPYDDGLNNNSDSTGAAYLMSFTNGSFAGTSHDGTIGVRLHIRY